MKIYLYGIFALLLAMPLKAAPDVAIAPALVMPDQNGQLRMLAAGTGGTPLGPEAMVWKANVEPGVYNVIVQYAASKAPPAVRLDVSDGRHLQDRFLPVTPPGPEGGASTTTQSLGPLAFPHAELVEFRLRRADPSEEASIVIFDVLLQPVGGTQPSIIKNPSEAVPQETPRRVNRADGAEMVWVPQGEFTMGGLGGPDAHTVFLTGFWIYKLPVTVRQYRQFCESTSRPMPDPPNWGWIEDHPMVNVSWYDSLAYAKWAGVRLPTEAEWEKAARGTDGRVLPWGNDFDTAKCQSSRDLHGFQGTAPVGHFPENISPYGAVDMAGNIWQWCSSRIGDYPYRADDGREDTDTHIENEKRTYRGGGWVMNSWRGDWMILHRGNFYPKYSENGHIVELRRDHIGFRCAVSNQ